MARKQVERQTVEVPVLDLINQRPQWFCVKLRNQGSTLNGRFLKLPYGVCKGIPDLIAWYGDPTFGIQIFIECKAPKGKQSTVQKIFESKIKRYGISYYVVDAVEQVEAILKKEERRWHHIVGCLAEEDNAII
jgi:hypothetical protein